MDNNSIKVRLVKPSDLDFIDQESHLSREKKLAKIRQGEVLLLIVNDEPVGHLWFDFLWSEIPFIELIRIQETHRKKGLSRALLGFLETHLKNMGYDILYSSSQLDEPEPQAWHRQMGFEECGMINGLNEGGIGEVFFRKSLS